MKMFIVLALLSTVAFARTSATKPIQEGKMEIRKAKNGKVEVKKAEDCDEKAKKPIEIKPETLSLGSGTAGCSLDEVQK